MGLRGFQPGDKTVKKIKEMMDLLKGGEMLASDVATRLGVRRDEFKKIVSVATQMKPDLYEYNLSYRKTVLGLNSEFWSRKGTASPYPVIGEEAELKWGERTEFAKAVCRYAETHTVGDTAKEFGVERHTVYNYLCSAGQKPTKAKRGR